MKYEEFSANTVAFISCRHRKPWRQLFLAMFHPSQLKSTDWHIFNHTKKSAIASHFWNMGHEIDNSANLLKSVNRKNELITWEKIFIHKHAHHIMNFKVPPESSLITSHLARALWLQMTLVSFISRSRFVTSASTCYGVQIICENFVTYNELN